MANELPNAVALMEDDTFRKWCIAAAVYQARLVVQEAATVADHGVRLKMAMDVIVNPQLLADRLVHVIAADPAVSGKGDTVQEITQDTMIAKVAEVWTILAKNFYPVVTP